MIRSMYFESSSSRSSISSRELSRQIVSLGAYFSRLSWASLCRILLVLDASLPPFKSSAFPELIASEQIYAILEKNVQMLEAIRDHWLH